MRCPTQLEDPALTAHSAAEPTPPPEGSEAARSSVRDGPVPVLAAVLARGEDAVEDDP